MSAAVDRFLSAVAVRDRYRISRATLADWRKRPDLAFPDPIVIAGRNYFSLSALDAWEQGRQTASAESDKSERPWATITDPLTTYESLVDALKARREQLGLSIREVEEVSGFSEGHLSHLESYRNGKNGRSIGRVSLPLWLGGLGCALVLVAHKEN